MTNETVVAVLISAVIGSVVSAVVNTFWYFGVQRREEKRDAKMQKLEQELEVVQKERLAKLDERLTADHRAHGDLHEKINRLPEIFVTRKECANTHDHMASEMALMRKAIDGVSARVAEIADRTARVETVTNIIADRMEIKL